MTESNAPAADVSGLPADAPPAPVIPQSELATREVLGRDAILSADDLRVEYVPVDEWKKGAVVRVVTLMAGAREALEDFLVASKDGKMKDARAFFASLVIVDEKNNPLFTEADVAALTKKAAAPIGRIFDAARRLNGIGAEDVEKEAKNSASEGSDTSL